MQKLARTSPKLKNISLSTVLLCAHRNLQEKTHSLQQNGQTAALSSPLSYPKVIWPLLEKHVDCQFVKGGPIPIIVISQGRTGSSVTWNTLYRLTSEEETDNDEDAEDTDGMDYDSVKAVEIAGRVVNESLDFFSKIPKQTIGSRWAEIYLCTQQHYQQQHHPKGRIVGLQWKPFFKTFYEPLAQETMERLVELRDPRIRIIYNIRNPIDRRLSNLRHDAADAADHRLKAHCPINDDECRKRHENSSSSKIYFHMNFTLSGDEHNNKPYKQKLLHWLNQDLNDVKKIKNMLAKSGIPHVNVRYDVLYGLDEEKALHEWRKLLRLVNSNNDGTMIDPDTLTMDKVRKHFSMAKTSSKRKKDVIENYLELSHMLKGTEFKEYLDD